MSWRNKPNRHAYCDGEIARLQAEIERVKSLPGNLMHARITAQVWLIAAEQHGNAPGVRDAMARVLAILEGER